MIHLRGSNPTEIAQCSALNEHLLLRFQMMVRCKYIPEATCETVNGITRYLTGSSNPIHNGILAFKPQATWDERIVEQLHLFQGKKLPFVWPIEEGSHEDLRIALERHNFQKKYSWGTIAGTLDKPIGAIEPPEGYTIERVTTDVALRAFSHLAFQILGGNHSSEEHYFNFFQQKEWNHWVAKDSTGTVVATGSSLIQDGAVSLWNGATLSEHRKHGLITTLAKIALQDATDKNCKIWVAFLNSEKMALGLMKQLGGRELRSIDVYYPKN